MYTLEYFIQKFQSVAIEHWVEGIVAIDNDRSCAIGHCGGYNSLEAMTLSQIMKKWWEIKSIPSRDHISDMACIFAINDNSCVVSDHFTDCVNAKERILKALCEIKAYEQGYTLGDKKQPIIKHVYHVVEVSSSIIEETKKLVLS